MLLSLLLSSLPLGSGAPPPDTGIAVSQQFAYGIRLEAGQHFAYGDLQKVGSRTEFRYSIRESVAARHQAPYSVLDYEPIGVRNEARYAILEATIQSFANTPRILHNGAEMVGAECTVSCDEGSAYWIARVTVGDPSQYAAVQLRDQLSIDLGFEAVELVVDGKSIERNSPAAIDLVISGISPLALLDAPFAQKGAHSWPAPTLASAIVAELLGPVEWNLPDWHIPPANAVFEGVTPVQAATAVVDSIGGLIESNPDGSIVCRSAFPVSIPNYPAAALAFDLTDHDVFSIRENIQPQRGFNRVIVANDAGSGTGAGGDRLEYEADEGSDISGIVRAYLGVQRPVTLVHTSLDVAITPRGLVQRDEVETIEFIEGAASLRYLPDSIVSVTYMSADLGAVQFSGSSLSAAVAGYSLATVAYRTSAWEWRVVKDEATEVQFVLMG